MKKFFFLLLIFQMALLSAYAQTCKITGTVIHKISGQPMLGVEVVVTPFNVSDDAIYQTVTDKYGKFTINVEPKVYNVIFSYLDYDDTTFYKIDLNTEKSNVINFELLLTHSSKKKNVSDYSETEPLTGGYAAEYGEAYPDAELSAGAVKTKRIMSMAAVEVSTDKSAPLTPADATSTASKVSPQAGMLTSGEVNDFRKWDMWKDLSETVLDQHRKEWDLYMTGRYTVQLYTADKTPAVNYYVRLVDGNRNILWEARTDNTGKAELWSSYGSGSPAGDPVIEAVYGDKISRLKSIKEFHDGINFLEIEESCTQPKNVDIVFAVDATGSMSDEIQYLQAELKDIIGRLGEKHKDITINLGSVFYRDHGDQYLVKVSDLSPDISITDKFIALQEAGGGGDTPEAVELALQSSLNEISWSKDAVARIVFLILDAPPHNTPEIRERLRAVMEKAALQGVRIVPVVCSGIDKSAEYLMRNIALATNGTYVFLTNHSGIGDKHIEPTTDKYDVEYMNNLFIRLIDQFTTIPPCGNKEAIKGLDVSENIYNKDEEKAIAGENIEEPMECYPNPVSSEITLDIKNDLDEVFFTDLGGKILMNLGKMSAGKHRIDLGSFPDGVFFMKYMIKEKWGHYKIMVMH